MRVHELAKSRGVTSKEVLDALATAGLPAKSASSSLSREQVAILDPDLAGRAASPSRPGPAGVASPTAEPATPAAVSSNDTEYVRSLVLTAFEAARASGKADWRVMSIAVLKNRVSQAIGEKFDQRRYGYPRILDLALDFPDLLAVDLEAKPPLATLLDVPPDSAPNEVDETVQVRPDLWRAVIDYEGGEPYVFHAGAAVPASQAPVRGTGLPVLPTLCADELDLWRRDFANAEAGLLDGREGASQRLAVWVEGGKGTRALPGVLQGRWNLYMKREVLARLRTWFADRGLPLPGDVVRTVERTRRPHLARKVTEESELRRLIVECVARMTIDELRQVNLPAGAVLRSRP